jgi:hypothetical protein
VKSQADYIGSLIHNDVQMAWLKFQKKGESSAYAG